MQKVLAIYYSQSGQLKQIIDNFCAPLMEAGINVEKVRIKLKNDFPFPSALFIPPQIQDRQ